MNKNEFIEKAKDLPDEWFEDFELEEDKVVNKSVKTLKSQLDEASAKGVEKDAEIQRLKAEHIRVLNNGAPLPVGEQEDPFVSLFKNIIK